MQLIALISRSGKDDQLSLLRFPSSAGSALAGKGVPGLSDHPKLQPLFQWRDQIELKLMERTLEEV